MLITWHFVSKRHQLNVLIVRVCSRFLEEIQSYDQHGQGAQTQHNNCRREPGDELQNISAITFTICKVCLDHWWWCARSKMLSESLMTLCLRGLCLANWWHSLLTRSEVWPDIVPALHDLTPGNFAKHPLCFIYGESGAIFRRYRQFWDLSISKAEWIIISWEENIKWLALLCRNPKQGQKIYFILLRK